MRARAALDVHVLRVSHGNVFGAILYSPPDLQLASHPILIVRKRTQSCASMVARCNQTQTLPHDGLSPAGHRETEGDENGSGSSSAIGSNLAGERFATPTADVAVSPLGPPALDLGPLSRMAELV